MDGTHLLEEAFFFFFPHVGGKAFSEMDLAARTICILGTRNFYSFVRLLSNSYNTFNASMVECTILNQTFAQVLVLMLFLKRIHAGSFVQTAGNMYMQIMCMFIVLYIQDIQYPQLKFMGGGRDYQYETHVLQRLARKLNLTYVDFLQNYKPKALQ